MTRKHDNNPKRTSNRPAKPKTSRANPPRPKRFGADPVGATSVALSQTTKDAGKGLGVRPVPRLRALRRLQPA